MAAPSRPLKVWITPAATFSIGIADEGNPPACLFFQFHPVEHFMIRLHNFFIFYIVVP